MNNPRYKIFIGYDSREDIAYQVCKQSIYNKTKYPNEVEVIPLKQDELREKGLYWRDIDKLASTEFTFTRFLLPELCNFEGWALFVDCDFLFTQGVEKLFDLADDRYAVMCAKHDYTPQPGIKMDGQTQHLYPRKNWSSMVLWNCSHPINRQITKELVNNPDTTGAFLHRFSWMPDNLIGEISHEWNWLVGWYKEPQDGKPKALHYTEGGPWFKEYQYCEYSVDWLLAEKSYLKEVRKLQKHKKSGPFDDIDDTKKDIFTSLLNIWADPNNYYYNDSFDTIIEKVKNEMGNKVAAIDSAGGINYTSTGNAYDPILQSFMLGANGYISDWNREENTEVPLVIRGLGGGSRKAIQKCRATGRDFYTIDTGYFGNVKTKYIHRVTKNNLQYIGPIIERPMDRAKQFGYKFKKFTPGSKILICPPSLKVMEMFNQPSPEEWVKQVIAEIKRYTNRPIEVRLKPNRTERVTTKSIQAALNDDVHCLVTYNSIAAVEALMEGKPAIVLGQNAASAVSETELRNIDNPKKPNKDEMDAFMAHLAYNQFTVPEMNSGFAWKTINEGS